MPAESKEDFKKDQKNKKKDKAPELSEEDQALKDNLNIWVDLIQSGEDSKMEDGIHKIFHEVITSTSSMTSIPKPLKFLSERYKALEETYNKTLEGKIKESFSDLMSLIAGTIADPYDVDTYRYLKKGTGLDFLQWGNEYQLHLSADIAKIYSQRLETQEDTTDLIEIAKKLLSFFMKSSSEIDAIDMLLEVDRLELAYDYIDKDNIKRIYDYLLASTPFSADQDEYDMILRTAFKFCMKVGEYFLAMRTAMKLDDYELIEQSYKSCTDPLFKKQLAFSLGRQRISVEDEDETLTEIMSNSKLHEFFLKLLQDLDLEKPKHPNDVYKAHIDNARDDALNSYMTNLAMTYTNAFVNVASTKDTLMQKEGAPWIASVKNEGILAATASLGMIYMWDIGG